MNFPISRSYLEHNERGHMLYNRRWTSLPGWFLSGDLLITRCRLLISSEIVRYISLPLNYFEVRHANRLQSQTYRCSKHARAIFGYLSQWKQTASCVCKWWCVCDIVYRKYNKLLPMVCMRSPCRPHMNTFQKRFSFSILTYNVMQWVWVIPFWNRVSCPVRNICRVCTIPSPVFQFESISQSIHPLI